jgi:putative ABC transport system permease protein
MRRRQFSARNGLVIAQVGLSLVLLVASGLFVRSLSRARSIDPGFDAERLLTVPLNIQLLRYTSDQGKAFYGNVVERVQALPGVESVTISRWLPLAAGGSVASLEVEGQQPGGDRFSGEGGGQPTDAPRSVLNNLIGGSYLRTMGIRITHGRDFDPNGNPATDRNVAIVSEEFARRHFGTTNALGKRIALGGPLATHGLEIVGIAEDAKYLTLDENLTRIVYLPASQNYVNGMTLIVRARGNPGTLRNDVARAVHSLDRSLPVAGSRTYQEWIGISIYAARAGAALLTGFGALALLLAAVGLYGVLAYAVSRRSREFGLRMALGAETKNVLRQVLGEGMGLVAIGVVAGLVAAFSVTRLLARFLYGISTTDPVTFAATTAALFAVAVLACLFPAVRATRVDPIKALKQE